MKKVLITITLTMLLVGLTKVKASVFTTDVVRNGQTVVEYTSSNTLTQQSNYYVTSLTSSTSSNSVQYVDYNVVSNNAQDGDLVEIPFIYSMPVSRDLTTNNTVSQRRCTLFTCTQYCATGSCAGMCEKYSCSQYSTLESNIETYEDFDYTINNTSFGAFIWTGSNYTTCQINENMLQCPVIGTGTIQRIRIYYNVRTNIATNFTIGLGNRWIYYKATGSAINNSIQEQTQQQQNNYENFMEQNQTYTDELNPNIQGSQEIGNYTQMEEDLINNIDLNTSVLDGIAIDTNTSNFIWQIVDGLRGMNIAIVTLFTSILGLGIVKLVLNR